MTFKKGHEHYNWKGGRAVDKDGYIVINVAQDPMFGGRRQIHEHRYVMAKHLGRDLYAYELVHHMNENKSDNRIENLKIMTRGEHSRLHRKGHRKIKDRACEYCGNIFKPPYSGSKKRFCKQKCAIKWSWHSADSTRKPKKRKPLPVLVCKNCHKDFTTKTKRPGKVNKFCSLSCVTRFTNKNRVYKKKPK